MVNTALYPVGLFAFTSELPAFRFRHKKKHETKQKSIFNKITLNCSLFNIFRYVVNTYRAGLRDIRTLISA